MEDLFSSKIYKNISTITRFTFFLIMSYTDLISKAAKQYLELETSQTHTRCSGCGNYGILNALMSAIALE